MEELKDIIVLKKGDIIYYNDGQICLVIPTEIKLDTKPCTKISKVLRPVKYETIYEAPKQILDKEEKEYLEALIRPFRKNVEVITIIKVKHPIGKAYIKICIWDENICLPFFESKTMYKGMEVNKKYTLKELGLFE